MATTQVRGELVDLNPGNPDYILDSTNAVTVINAGGNQYNFNGVYGKFGAKIGTITLTGVPAGHPIAFINSGKTSQISYTGTVDEGTATGPDGNTYTFYSGTVTLTVSADFGTISYYCKIHGYMGGQDNLVYTYSESGLKIPTGTNANRPATDVAGMIRNNTNETSESSASCEEYYNGTAWKKINNAAIPPPLAFKTVTYTGNGSSGNSITGVGFKPDFVWIKSRSGTIGNWSHTLMDSTRGADKSISINNNGAEVTNANGLESFDADGFTVGSAGGGWNYSGSNYVAWCWKANGGTTSSNTDGSTTSTVQAYPEAGFSIVKYTGTGANASVGHGLGVAPKFLMIKKLNSTSDWTAFALDNTKYLEPNGTPPFRTANVWQNTSPTSSVFTLTTGGDSNGNGNEYIAYLFSDIDNVSKVGSYTGNGGTQSITVGFQPDYLVFKSTNNTEDWYVMDSTRGVNNVLYWNSDGAEGTSAGVSFTSTGFELTSSFNASARDYLYLAFKTN